MAYSGDYGGYGGYGGGMSSKNQGRGGGLALKAQDQPAAHDDLRSNAPLRERPRAASVGRTRPADRIASAPEAVAPGGAVATVCRSDGWPTTLRKAPT
eukprot:4506900-Prymnesium_polylepis.1